LRAEPCAESAECNQTTNEVFAAYHAFGLQNRSTLHKL
jgi:hypothetical protein